MLTNEVYKHANQMPTTRLVKSTHVKCDTACRPQTMELDHTGCIPYGKVIVLLQKRAKNRQTLDSEVVFDAHTSLTGPTIHHQTKYSLFLNLVLKIVSEQRI